MRVGIRSTAISLRTRSPIAAAAYASQTESRGDEQAIASRHMVRSRRRMEIAIRSIRFRHVDDKVALLWIAAE